MIGGGRRCRGGLERLLVRKGSCATSGRCSSDGDRQYVAKTGPESDARHGGASFLGAAQPDLHRLLLFWV